MTKQPITTYITVQKIKEARHAIISRMRAPPPATGGGAAAGGRGLGRHERKHTRLIPLLMWLLYGTGRLRRI